MVAEATRLERLDRREDRIKCDLQDAENLDYTDDGQRWYNQACREMDMLDGLRRMYRHEGRDLQPEDLEIKFEAIENLLARAAQNTKIDGIFFTALEYDRTLQAPGMYPAVIVDLSTNAVYCKTLSEGWWIESLPAWKKRLNISDPLLKYCWEHGATVGTLGLYELACIIQAAAQSVLKTEKVEITRIAQVAEKCGVSTQTIRNRAKKLGIPTGQKLTAEQVESLCAAGRK